MEKLPAALLIGLVIGIIDIVPMMLQRIPTHSTVSAFIHYVTASVVIVLLDISGPLYWLGGGILGLALMTPMMIHVGHTDKKPIPIIAGFSFGLGTLAAVAGHFLT